MSLDKYRGIIPAFYACYDEQNEISEKATRALARHLVNKGVKGMYVGGSSGECIYLEKEERMKTLEAVMAEVKGECTVIAHVGCNNTRESMQLAMASTPRLSAWAASCMDSLVLLQPTWAMMVHSPLTSAMTASRVFMRSSFSR